MDILQEDCEAVKRALTTGPKLCFVGDEASKPSTWALSLVSGLNRSEVYPFDGGICGWRYARLATLDEVSKYIEPTVEKAKNATIGTPPEDLPEFLKPQAD